MRLALLPCALVFLAACSGGGADPISGGAGGSSSGSSGEEGSSGADGTSGSSGSSGGASSSSGSSGSSGDPDPTPKETKVGTITIQSTSYKIGTTPVEMGSAWGSFYHLPPPAPGAPASTCTTSTAGACTVNACTFAASTTDAGAPAIAYTHAGVATITGVHVNDGSMTLTPGGYGYQTVSGSVAFFKGGESVGVKAPGNPNGAPAFDVKLTAPSSVVVTAPVFDAQSRVSVGSGQNLGVAWQNAGGGEVAVQIASGTSAKSALARCAFPASAGQGVVPSSVLATVGAVGAQTSITVSAESRAVKNPDGWDITVTLQAYGIRPGGNAGIASGLLVIQ